ncbi:MAG: globin domain-containing protein [Actinomycetes bacterium]
MEQYDELPLEDEIALLEENLVLIRERTDRAIEWFYATIFLHNPELRGLFPPAMDTQRDRFFRALTGGVRNLRDPDTFVPMLAQLGRDHRKYGVRAEHYPVIEEALITALRKTSENIWVPELDEAWRRAYRYMAATMIDGAQEAATREPAWWRAEVVAHERRSEDIAVITVRTDRPYDYRAGQYATIEIPQRPRDWRSYSMATAPSPDGLVEFHVRAVGAGWVSGPLVWRTTVGDVMRLGAPMGDMTADQQSQRDILCIAGGTGLAPIKAIVDDLTKWNTARRVHVFFGVRHARELYDIGALQRLAAINPWLHVVPVVSEDPGFGGERGLLPDVIARHGDWADHDVFVCGSPDMSRATISRLGELGVPADRVRYDVMGGEESHPAVAQVIDLRRSRESRGRIGSLPGRDGR